MLLPCLLLRLKATQYCRVVKTLFYDLYKYSVRRISSFKDATSVFVQRHSKESYLDMSNDLQTQLIEKVKASPVFAIQIDESVDVGNLSQLIVFIRYIGENNIEEDVLFCQPLRTTNTA